MQLSNRLLATLLAFTLPATAASQDGQFQPNNHICYIGNAQADRMQHHGWLETYLHALHPDNELVFRNLGFPGDEIANRPRSMDFGSADEWLTKCKADTVFCFFGRNESLRGAAGLASFKTNFVKMLDGMAAQSYNGSTPPRLIIFGPIAHEDLQTPHLPDGSSNNAKLETYTDAMRSICDAKGVQFIDLFSITQRLYAESERPLTLNGIHLLDEGNQLVAKAIMAELFPDRVLPPVADVQALRAAVLEKNYYWFSRYRVVDGYNVYGGRSKLAWHGQSNADVMRREMEIFDAMTSNRDERVWALAQGRDVHIADDNLPASVPVRTNKEGPLEGGAFPYLGAEEAIAKMQVHDGLAVNVFASEEMFPRLANPVQMSVDTDSRLWVSVWPSYPHWHPTEPRQDALLIFPDEDQDGVADDCLVFADELNSITGFEFWGGGVIVAAPPELWFLKDTDGDDKADYRRRILQGISSADTHHSANAMLIGPDGWLYWSRGIFNVSSFETPTTLFRSRRSGVYRFNPRTFEVEFHFPIGPNPHGHVFDQWGYEFANDGTTGTGSYVNIGNGVGNKQWFEKRVRPVAATGLLASSHFPPRMQGNFLICNVIGTLGVLQHEISYQGADILANEVDPLLLSDDPNFRPTDLEIGGDGALYISDWHNALIGHMQHNMRDPNRDHSHGRIYRLSCPDRPTLDSARLKGRPVRDICETFFARENNSRYRARLELSGRHTGQLMPELFQFINQLDVLQTDPQRNEAQALLECLWVCEEHRAFDEIAKRFPIQQLLSAEEPRVRAAVVRTLGHCLSYADFDVEVIARAADDASPLVRAEALKAAAQMPTDEAAEIIYKFTTVTPDSELGRLRKYASDTVQLTDWLQERLVDGSEISDDARAYALRFGSPELLRALPTSDETLRAVLRHPETELADMQASLSKLAQRKSTSVARVLAELIQGDRNAAPSIVTRWANALSARPAEELAQAKDQLSSLATQGPTRAARAAGYRAWVTAVGATTVYDRIADQPNQLKDFLTALPGFADKDRGMMLQTLIELATRPSEDALPLPTEIGLRVDYFSPPPPDVAMSSFDGFDVVQTYVLDGIRLELPTKALPDAFALRFVADLEVPAAGPYTFFCRSDDGSRMYLDGVEIINNDGDHGSVERKASLELDAGRHRVVITYRNGQGARDLLVRWKGPGIAKQPIPASAFSFGGNRSVAALATVALQSVPGHDLEKATFFVSLLDAGNQVGVAVQALEGLDRAVFSPKQQQIAARALLRYLAALPNTKRTSPTAARAFTLARRFTKAIADEEAMHIMRRLQSLEIQVVDLAVIPHRMMFDQQELVVERGRAVAVRFKNVDAMPHNFVLIEPGSLETIGKLSEATGRGREAIARDYVPVSEHVIAASEMLQNGETQSITFDAPAETGVYPFVCTYPGHWRRMFGALIVVDDKKAYEAQPDAYMAQHSIKPQDAMLSRRTTAYPWTYDELIEDVQTLHSGRSFATGKTLFRTATCVGCHALAEEGQVFGPDLKSLAEEKHTYAHILGSIVNPSEKIDDKYRSRTFYLETGRIVTGMVIEQTDDHYKIAVGPMGTDDLCDDSAIIVMKSEVEDQANSKDSLMPAGLLDQLTREEILDLVAYVYAKGDPNCHLFTTRTSSP